MDITPSRLAFLSDALEGLKATGVPLVALRDGKAVPAVERDDVGVSYIVPQIAQAFHLSLTQAIDVFYYSIIGLSLAVGLLGMFCLYRTARERVVASVGFAVLGLYCCKIGDVYVFAPCVEMALLPWIMFAVKSVGRKTSLFGIFAVAGLVAGFCHTMRAHSGSGVMIFALLGLILANASPVRRRLFALALLIGSFLVPMVGLKVLTVQRDRYIHEHNPAYEFALNRHPFWHSVYIGLGFVYNPYVPAYRDEVGEEKVRGIDPTLKYVSPGYEKVLRAEVLKIRNPTFWINNFGAKAGVIAAYLIIFGNLGLLLSLLTRSAGAFGLPFLAASAFMALPGLLVVPYKEYLLGFIALTVLFNMDSINYWLRSRVRETSEAGRATTNGQPRDRHTSMAR